MSRFSSKLGFVFNIMAMIITVGVLIATVLSYFAPIVNPNTVWWIAFLGLGGQLLILSNFIATFYWIARAKWIAVLPGVVFLFGIGFFGDFYQVQLVKKYHPEESSDYVTLATFNVKNFQYDSHSYENIANFINQNNVDLVCFQEFGSVSSSYDSSRLEQFYGRYEHKVVLADMAILSKYPLHGVKLMRFPNTANNVVKAEVVRDDNTFVLYNVHLQTTEFNQTSGGSVKALVDRKNSTDAIKVAGGAMKRNYIARAFQADSIVKTFEEEKYPIILAGDINDTPMSYVYSTLMGDRMDDSYKVAGGGYGYTYRNLMRLFRIDYIMCQQDDFNVFYYDSPNVDYSDHNPVIVKFEFIQKVEDERVD